MSAFTTSMWLVVRTRSVAELGALVLLMLATTLAPGLLQAQWALGLPVVADRFRT